MYFGELIAVVYSAVAKSGLSRRQQMNEWPVRRQLQEWSMISYKNHSSGHNVMPDFKMLHGYAHFNQSTFKNNVRHLIRIIEPSKLFNKKKSSTLLGLGVHHFLRKSRAHTTYSTSHKCLQIFCVLANEKYFAAFFLLSFRASTTGLDVSN